MSRENKYLCCATGLVFTVVIGAFLSKIPGFKYLESLISFNPKPIYWILAVLVICFIIPQAYIPGVHRIKINFTGIAVLNAVLFLTLRYLAGFLLRNVAKSPYDLSPLGIILNMLDIFPALIAREMTRAYVIAVVNKESRRFFVPSAVIILSLLFGLLEVNFAKTRIVMSSEEIFIFITKDVLPHVARSCFLTVLVFCGGAAPAVMYAGVISAFMRLFPFLPSLPWIADSAIGITYPIIASLFIWEQYKISSHKQTVKKRENIAAYTAALVIIVSFVWFVNGVFHIYPLVILTGSMEPGIFPGDVILIEKFSNESEIYSLAENDIINFTRDDITITHRIIEVCYDERGNISFITKGDNNASADNIPVVPGDINGTVKMVVPKAGLPIIWMQNDNSIPEGVTDY